VHHRLPAIPEDGLGQQGLKRNEKKKLGHSFMTKQCVPSAMVNLFFTRFFFLFVERKLLVKYYNYSNCFLRLSVRIRYFSYRLL
jgi:hypothetical protein